MHSGRRGNGMNRRQFLKGSLGAAGVAVAWANVKADQGIPELPEALPEDHRTATLESLREWQAQRFGMFVHWGPVSLRGTEIGWSRGREVPVDEYDALADDFNPEQFDADAWIRTAKEAGMKYFVITSKHHDGFCIWPSDYTDYDLTRTPYGGDILEELAEACERHGIDLGFYYSILDWRHPDYPYGSSGGDTEKPNPDMEAYVEFLHNQVRELIERYNPRIMWFDGEWEDVWTAKRGAELYRMIKSLDPAILVNNRVGAGRQADGYADETYGDFATPEQQIGRFNRDRAWESCITLCQQWAWRPEDTMKSLEECLRTLIMTAGGDGNLLFNVGPMPDGRIEPRQVERLQEMGAWLDQYGRAIYGTRGGPVKPGETMASTCAEDRVHVFVFDGADDVVTLPDLGVPVTQVEMLTAGDVDIREPDQRIEIRKSSEDILPAIAEITVDGDATAITLHP